MVNKQNFGTPFSVTNGTTTATSITATVTAGTLVANYITDISASSDKSEGALVLKEGSTIIWQDYIRNTTPYQHTFSTPLWGGQRGTITTLTVSGTLVANANIAGFKLSTDQ